jgi:hypothetical protein
VSEREDARAREARDALERVRRDSESVGTSALARASRRFGDHVSARDAVGEAEGGRTDPIELWGRRIGRGLSVIGALLLAWYLGVQLRLW